MKTDHLKSNWSPISLLGALVLLLILVLSNVGGSILQLPQNPRRSSAGGALSKINRLNSLFASSNVLSLLQITNSNPFFTTFYLPAPAPKPPATKKVDAVYQGFYQTADGRKLAFIKLGDALTVAPLGTKIAADFAVSEITFESVKLTNAAAAAQVLEFNARKQIEIPNVTQPAAAKP